MTHWQDIINGLFELSGGLFVALNCLDIIKRKSVAGQTFTAMGFFTAWGLWNLYFYPSLHQTWSSIGAIGVMSANAVMIGLMVRYRTRA